MPEHTPRASGTLLAHYAPSATVRLMSAKQIQTALEIMGKDAANIAVYSRTRMLTPARSLVLRRMPEDAHEASKELFAALRDFDTAEVKLIWVELPPESEDWEGVRDRLQRAAAA